MSRDYQAKRLAKEQDIPYAEALRRIRTSGADQSLRMDTTCALCKHAIEPRSEAERVQSGIDDEWWHIVPTSGGATSSYLTLANHDTVPITLAAHPA